MIARRENQGDTTAGRFDNFAKQQVPTGAGCQLTDLKAKTAELEEQLIQSQAELKQTREDFQALQNNAKEVIAITAERDQLRKTNQDLAAQNIALDEEVGSLTRTVVIKWFLAGAGVLFLGWIIGKSSGNRRRNLF